MDRKNESNLEGFAKILVNLGLSSQAIQLFAMTVPTYSIYHARRQYIDLSESLLTSNLPRPVYELSIFKRAYKAMKEACQSDYTSSMSGL